MEFIKHATRIFGCKTAHTSTKLGTQYMMSLLEAIAPSIIRSGVGVRVGNCGLNTAMVEPHVVYISSWLVMNPVI